MISTHFTINRSKSTRKETINQIHNSRKPLRKSSRDFTGLVGLRMFVQGVKTECFARNGNQVQESENPTVRQVDVSAPLDTNAFDFIGPLHVTEHGNLYIMVVW